MDSAWPWSTGDASHVLGGRLRVEADVELRPLLVLGVGRPGVAELLVAVGRVVREERQLVARARAGTALVRVGRALRLVDQAGLRCRVDDQVGLGLEGG